MSMQHPINPFKRAIRVGHAQIGLWQGLASPYTAELCATVGYDWLLIDAEHVPNTIQTILSQLQAVAAHQVTSVVRPASNDATEIKRLLDIGVQNLLIPMVQNAEEARAAVAAVRYPPNGTRGVGTALSRAARWGGVQNYLARSDEEICLLCQVETVGAIKELDKILQVDGVDGVFVGPADLAASMGYLGNPEHPDVRAVTEDAIARIRKAGKASGILQGDVGLAQHYLDMGVSFIAVGVDTVLLRRAAKDLLMQFRRDTESAENQLNSAY